MLMGEDESWHFYGTQGQSIISMYLGLIFLRNLKCSSYSFFIIIILFRLLPNIFAAVSFTTLNEMFFNNFIFWKFTIYV